MMREQKKLIKKGHSKEEAIQVTMINELVENKYKKMGFSEKESYEMAEHEVGFYLTGKSNWNKK
tara:strand:+ start:116 stop:307 length:192 start_codon:yes stop_codon:yes gene_type:complete